MKSFLLASTLALLSTKALAQNAGDLDPSFNGTGVVQDTCCATFNGRLDLAIQPDNKIVAATENATTFLATAIRYNWDGTHDAGFGSNGTVSLDSVNTVSKVLVQPDGKVLVGGGYAAGGSTNVFALTRRSTNGSADGSFNENGVVNIKLWDAYHELQDLALQADGKMVFSGYAYKPFPGQLNLVVLGRLDADGYLDLDFADNGSGWDTIRWSNWNSTGVDVEVLPDGKILLMGVSQSGVSGIPDTTMMMRFNQDGSVDNDFGTNGIVRHMALIGAYEMAVQSNGKILVAGYGSNGMGSTRDMLVVRLNADGSTDNGFGANGEGYADFGLNEEAEDLAVQSDGSIVLAGRATDNALNDMYQLTRLLPDGNVDLSFGSNGSVYPFQDPQQTRFRAVALHPDNRIVAAGFGEVGGQFSVMRFTPGSVGVDDVQSQTMQFYPNPSIGSFTVSSSQPGLCEIIDAYGRTVHQLEINQRITNVQLPNSLVDGCYFVRLTSDTKTSLTRFVLQRW